MKLSSLIPILIALYLSLAGCQPEPGSTRYANQNFEGRWDVLSCTRFDFLHGTLDTITFNTTEGYFDFYVKRLGKEDAFIISRELFDTLAMLRPQRDSAAFMHIIKSKHRALYWDWNHDATELYFSCPMQSSQGVIKSVVQVSETADENMTLTYTEALSDSSYFQEALSLRRQ